MPYFKTNIKVYGLKMDHPYFLRGEVFFNKPTPTNSLTSLYLVKPFRNNKSVFLKTKHSV